MNHGKGDGKLITLAGTIGAGKTEWGKVIAKHFEVELLEEKVDGNPFWQNIMTSLNDTVSTFRCFS